MCWTVDKGRGDGLDGGRRSTRHRMTGIARFTDALTVVERQEPVSVAVAAAVRERAAGARRHVVVVALLGRTARTRLRRQLTDFYTERTRSLDETATSLRKLFTWRREAEKPVERRKGPEDLDYFWLSWKRIRIYRQRG